MIRKEEMTREQRMLRSIIVAMRNDIVGGNENMTYDYSEEELKEMGWKFPSREEVIERIYEDIMNGNSKVVMCPNECWGLERKHIHFMGEKFVRELIEDRVDYDINKNGWIWL